jgi:two-component system phosphate regulon response regulator OmpR
MKNSILIVDDDKRLRELLEDYLIEKKFKVHTCDDFSSAEEILTYFIFDLVIVDRMMPGGDGINLIRIIKKKSSTPVIMLTAMGESAKRIEGLKIGADDYVAKPFEPEELYLRINNLLELFDQNFDQNEIINFGDYFYNLSTLQLKKGGKNIYLTEGEDKLLNYLAIKKNDIVLREELAEKEYNENEFRKIDVQVTRLRQKIEKNPKRPIYIKTIRGKGYKLITN